MARLLVRTGEETPLEEARRRREVREDRLGRGSLDRRVNVFFKDNPDT